MSPPSNRIETLYRFQDQALRVIGGVETSFYLSGGTAASRGYLDHRYSDDLDLFVNDDPQYQLWSDRIIQSLNRVKDWDTQVLMRDERIIRINLQQPDAGLKIELINDVPAHVGMVTNHPVLGRLDSPENILANKISALIGRDEPKDVVDVWGFCCLMGLSLQAAITDASSKAAGIFAADLARRLLSVSYRDWEIIQWINPPSFDKYQRDLVSLGETLLGLPS